MASFSALPAEIRNDIAERVFAAAAKQGHATPGRTSTEVTCRGPGALLMASKQTYEAAGLFAGALPIAFETVGALEAYIDPAAAFTGAGIDHLAGIRKEVAGAVRSLIIGGPGAHLDVAKVEQFVVLASSGMPALARLEIRLRSVETCWVGEDDGEPELVTFFRANRSRFGCLAEVVVSDARGGKCLRRQRVLAAVNTMMVAMMQV
ncbi:hypothetical protein LTR08_002418 [Meristemomyces frigidus]|nr:hypothetical protein LTR08_002418 [Meristemomyces frigidus]